MWLAEYDIDVYNAPEVFSVPPLTRLILPVMSGRTSRVLFHQTTMVILVAFIFLVVLYIPVALIVEKRLIFHADGATTVMTML